jgi:hypothetical protein
VGVDTVRFGDDISVATAVFSKVGDDLAITLSDPPDTLRIENHFASVRHGVERFVFADGFVLTFDQARQVLADAQVSGGDDVATGFAGRVDLMTGGAGHDLLAGLSGGDAYSFHRGDGYEITDDRGAGFGDRLRFEDHVADEAPFRRAAPGSLMR